MEAAHDPEHARSGKPRKRRRWLVLLFLVPLSLLTLRTLVATYSIPTPAMAGTILPGDVVLATKWTYGPRWGAKRMPVLGAPQRGDIVIFNYPEGDTIVPGFENQSYYQLVRDHGRDKLFSGQLRLHNVVDGAVARMLVGVPEARELADREPFVKRCVAVAGDTLEVIGGEVYINGVREPARVTLRFGYETTLKVDFTERVLARIKKDLGINVADLSGGESGAPGAVNVSLDAAQVAMLAKDNAYFGPLTRQDHPRGFAREGSALPYFPHHADFDWSEDNFGPLWIPKKGATLQLDTATWPLYERVIGVYEGNHVQVREGRIFINGLAATSYTFRQDYYWVMGDNRHRTLDSRFWGFVPFDHVIAKASAILYSVDPEGGLRSGRSVRTLE